MGAKKRNARTRKFRKETAGIAVLSSEGTKALHVPTPRDRALFACVLAFGLRASEVMSLHAPEGGDHPRRPNGACTPGDRSALREPPAATGYRKGGHK